MVKKRKKARTKQRNQSKPKKPEKTEEKKKKIPKKKPQPRSPSNRRILWAIISCLVLLGVIILSVLAKRNQEQLEEIFSKMDPLFTQISPKFDSLKNEVIDLQRRYYSKAVEPLVKKMEKSLDGVLGGIKKKLDEYKEKLKGFLPEENWFTNSTGFPKMNVTAKYPVIIIPGTITSELEVWQGRSCIKTFRAKVWGEVSMLWNFVKNKTCWLEHLKLDPRTGLDPEGVKVRPSPETVDYLFPGFWVWGIIMQELSKIGYDVNNMEIAAYDWRLGFRELESRDAYFTRLQNKFELFYKIHQQKVVVLAHSLGGNVWYHFMNWIEYRQPFWINKYVESCVVIGAPLLGVPKALSAVLSGEMKDSADLNFFDSVLEKILSREERAQVFRSWRSNMEMLPKGEGIWGTLINVDDGRDITVKNMIPFLKESTDEVYSEALDHIFVGNLDVEKLDRNMPNDTKFWSNPFATTLPSAPFMKYYCFYGVGIPTEVRYQISKSNSTVFSHQLDFERPDFPIDYDENGDGTVPYVSLNHACSKLWKKQKHNPSGLPVIVREYEHKPVDNVLSKRFDFRGGGASGNHVNIMGNLQMIKDILYVVSGEEERVKEVMIVEEERRDEL